MPSIGVSTPRRDSEPKVRGATHYAADLNVPGLLHARLLLANDAHALIRSIDTTAARELPGVVAVLTADDLPIVATGSGRSKNPLAREEILYAGQPLAIAVAETEALAADAIELIEVELEPVEAVIDVEGAVLPGAVRARLHTADEDDDGDLGDAHAAVAAGAVGDEEELSDNVLGTARLAGGDVDAALAASEAVVRGRFHTPWVYQGYIEPQTASAWFDVDDDLIVSTSTQAPFMTRDEVASLFGLPVHKVRVRSAPLGGGFGGKMMIPEPLVVSAALATRRPVRLAMTRSEDFAAANPAGAEVLEVELGSDREGNFTGIRTRIWCDRGATDSMGVESIAAMLSAGPYRWRAHHLTCYGVSTNRVTFGAYRAPTAPPAAFAVESLIDELAGRLGIDPLELRLRNVLVPGDRTVAGQELKVFGARECLERLGEQRMWSQRDSLPDGEGVGLAIGWWPGGYEPAAAACRLDSDGHVTVITGVSDMTGVQTTFAAIAAEAFGVSMDRVRVVNADTSSAPYSGVSGGSKITYTVGRAVEMAARQARERLLDVAAEELEIAPEDLEIVDGSVQPVGVPAKAMAIEQLAQKVLTFGSPYAPVEGQGLVSLPQVPQSAAHLSHVRVDRETGAVTVVGHVIAQDVGRALNPALVEGQMHGGTTQGLGWALLEEIAYDEHGQPVAGSFVDYAMPTAGGVPAIETAIVEVPAPEGPFGAKGVGEAPVIGVAGAVANAVAAATGGVRMRRLPMTPERVWRAIDGNGDARAR
ncbi:MAG TPA: xanthine dehydrogenase family protein molybdopterin-binding subunit [Solirubrobacteraceae bacterium]|nr:xanthine dehydrogenase family protein molybdopterin-binding subunit [Solirubrobacteraceae bacterium]